MKFVIGSQNLHKIRELREMLKPVIKADIFSLRDFPNYIPPEEDGETFEDNAKIKALDAAKTLNAIVLADDSGLVIPSLKGLPGVRSRRFAGENATDNDNRLKLIQMLKSLPEGERTGYFECCIAIANPDGILKIAKGRCEGDLLVSPRGGQGFGYDPLFVKLDYHKTFAELEEDVKNRISHRRKALDKLSYTLEMLLADALSH